MADIQQDNSKRIPGKPFTKGDARINRKGRPKSFDALRKLAQSMAGELAYDSQGQPIVMWRDDGKGNAERVHVTYAELILMGMATSRGAGKLKFTEIAFGKVPDELVNTGEVKLVVKYDQKPDDTPA